MLRTPLAEQISVVVYGRRNAGKSSLVNRMLGMEASIVSDRPGTTTDPVVRSVEMGALGPVAVTDTAGYDDDEDELGTLRVDRSRRRLETADIVLFVPPGDEAPHRDEEDLADLLHRQDKPVLVVLTRGDRGICDAKRRFAPAFRKIAVDNLSGRGIEDLNAALRQFSDQVEREITPLEGLVQAGDLVLLVTPIDDSAPKARMILPQVEVIRDILDKDCFMAISKEHQLKDCFASLGVRPALAVTDSQAFSEVREALPPDQLLTSFSILFARKKGDLAFFVEGIQRLEDLPEAPRVLILESCKHHRMDDDIGTVKIPNLFRRLVRTKATFELRQDAPPLEELRGYHYVIQCAGCMTTRNDMLRRIALLREADVPGTNYGLFLAWAKGLLPRALEPFPVEHALYRSFRRSHAPVSA